MKYWITEFINKKRFMFSRYLNLAQNKIEKLPTSQDFEEECSPSNKRRSRVTFTREKGYSAPFLEELYLQVNILCKIFLQRVQLILAPR